MAETKKRRAKKVTLTKLKKPENQEYVTINPKRNVDILFKWAAPSRVWYPKTRTWYLTSAIVVLAIILFVVLSRYPSYPWLILMLTAFLLLWFLYGSTPPDTLENKITNKGIFTYGVLYPWEEIQHFWFAEKGPNGLLYIDFPRHMGRPRITLLVHSNDEDDIFDILIGQLKYASPNEAQYNFFAKMIYGTYQPISKYLPDLDKVDEKNA